MVQTTLKQLLMLALEAFFLFLTGVIVYVLISRASGVELLGEYCLVFAWISLFQVMSSFGMPEFIMRETARLAPDSGHRYINHTLLLGLCSSAVFSLLMASAMFFTSYPANIIRALLLGSLTLVPVTISSIIRATCLADGRTHQVLFISSLESLSLVSVSVFLIWTGRGIVALVLALLGAKLVSCSMYLCILARRRVPLWFSPDPSFLRQILPSLFTFALSSSLGYLSMRINIILLSNWASISTVGLFAAASKIMETSLLIPGMFCQVMLPQLSRQLAATDKAGVRHYERALALLFSVTTPLGVGLIFFASVTIVTLFGRDFVEAVSILQVLMIFFLIESGDSMMSISLKAGGRQNADLRMYTINPLSNIVLSILLIPGLGAVGAAVAKLAGVTASFVLRHAYLARHQVGLNWVRVTGRPLVVSVVLIACILPLRGRVDEIILGVIYIIVSGSISFPALQKAGRGIRRKEIEEQGGFFIEISKA